MRFTTRHLEQIMLGNALRGRGSLAEGDFRFPPHPLICRAINEVRAAGVPIGLLTVGNWLKSHNVLEEAGGTIYLAELILTAGSDMEAPREDAQRR